VLLDGDAHAETDALVAELCSSNPVVPIYLAAGQDPGGLDATVVKATIIAGGHSLGIDLTAAV